jgi:hypothetical protein
MSLLPVEPAYRLAERANEQRWLVTGLWSEQAVGIVGGEPKCCKSFLALDLAVSVAAGTPCLRRFSVSSAGRVLLYAAEDALHIVRRRLEGICATVGVSPPIWISRSSPLPRSGLILTPTAEASPRPLPSCNLGCSSSIPSCACTASMRIPAARWRRCSPTCASRSVAMPSPCSSSTTPKKAPDAPVPDRPCAAHRSSMPGATPTSICVATAMISLYRWNTAPRHRYRAQPPHLAGPGVQVQIRQPRTHPERWQRAAAPSQSGCQS